jgi:UDP-glucose 4-epimerase
MIGTRLCEKLLESNHLLYCFDARKNIFNENIDKKTEIVDLMNLKHLIEIFPVNIDIIIHLAANARVYDLIQNPELSIENVQSTFNILEICRQKI